jgi:protein gp37
MSDKTNIGYAHASWNIVTGCNKVSPGCKHCSAEREFARLRKNEATVYYGRQFDNVGFHRKMLTMPISWQTPRIVFVATMGDLFHDAIPDETLLSIFAVMSIAKQHKYLIFTKRVKRAMMFSRDPRVYAEIQAARSALGKKTFATLPRRL